MSKRERWDSCIRIYALIVGVFLCLRVSELSRGHQRKAYILHRGWAHYRNKSTTWRELIPLPWLIKNINDCVFRRYCIWSQIPYIYMIILCQSYNILSRPRKRCVPRFQVSVFFHQMDEWFHPGNHFALLRSSDKAIKKDLMRHTIAVATTRYSHCFYWEVRSIMWRLSRPPLAQRFTNYRPNFSAHYTNSPKSCVVRRAPSSFAFCVVHLPAPRSSSQHLVAVVYLILM